MPANPTLDYYLALHEAAKGVLERSLVDTASISRVHSDELADISSWCAVLSGRAEVRVLENARRELSFGLYAMMTGSYRHAFASLRLVLEQSLLSVFFSVNRLELAEWIAGEYDTNWASLTGESGVFSQRYAKSFFPEIEEPAKIHLKLAKQTYRELSEFVHGNKAIWDLAPKQIQFDERLISEWLERSKIVVDTLFFALVLRFTKEFDSSTKARVAERVLTRLGHIEPIRVAYGGVPNTL